MRILKSLLLFVMFGVGTLSLQACTQDGPFEEAGENIDNAVDDTADAIEDACEDATNSNC